MTTYATIIVSGPDNASAVFYVDREGYPSYIVPLLRDIAKDTKSVWEFIGKLIVELGDAEMLILQPPAWGDYEYFIDYTEGKISYEEDGKTIVIPLK